MCKKKLLIFLGFASFRFIVFLAALILLLAVPRPAQTQSALWTGDGGSGIRITVLEPAGIGLGVQDQALLPLIQSTIIGVFQRFSAMVVFDRQNLESILAEQQMSLDAAFADDDYSIRIGHLTNARYIVFGSITAIAGNYFLELAVTYAETGERRASYPPRQVSLLALRDLSAIRHAAADLLVQLGVELGESALLELRRPDDSARIQVENELAMGIAADRRGAGLEAAAHFFRAAAMDPSMFEALNRASVVSANIAAGTMLADIQNRMQEYREWRTVLDAAGIFYAANLPFEFQYDTDIRNRAIDFARGTADFSVAVSLAPRADAWRTINDLRQGLRRASRGEWDHIPLRTRQIVVPDELNINVIMELVNENGLVLSGVTYTFSGLSDSRRTSRELLFRNVSADEMGTGVLSVRVASINGVPAQAAGETGLIQISTASLWGSLGRERFGAAWHAQRRRGRNGAEIGISYLWKTGGDKPGEAFLIAAGVYVSPIPFTTLGIEARLGWSAARADIGGEHSIFLNDIGELYVSGAPVAGFVFPVGQSSRLYIAALVEIGSFGIWTGALTNWAAPGFAAGAELGLDTGFIKAAYRAILFNEGFAHGFTLGIGIRF